MLYSSVILLVGIPESRLEKKLQIHEINRLYGHIKLAGSRGIFAVSASCSIKFESMPSLLPDPRHYLNKEQNRGKWTRRLKDVNEGRLLT